MVDRSNPSTYRRLVQRFRDDTTRRPARGERASEMYDRGLTWFAIHHAAGTLRLHIQLDQLYLTAFMDGAGKAYRFSGTEVVASIRPCEGVIGADDLGFVSSCTPSHGRPGLGSRRTRP